jgi:heme oxygenase (mycobilin-producing)
MRDGIAASRNLHYKRNGSMSDAIATAEKEFPMSIMRINEFRAHEGQGDALRDRLKVFVPVIAASDGCLSCQLLQSQKNRAHIVLLEVWQSAEAHQASLKNIPADDFKETMKLVAVPPTGEYYDTSA